MKSNWLDDVLNATEESEAPERYYWWAGLATISAVVRKNVWIDRQGQYTLYPNIYVALVSSKSGARKGGPISLCKKLLYECDCTRVISGANTIQGLTQELATDKKLASEAILTEAHGALISPEFDTFLVEDPKAFSTLTDLYDTHAHEPVWEKILKSGKETLKNPCITLLVASNEALFDSVMKQKDIEGGFIGRTFVVYESKDKKINPLVDEATHRLDIPKLSIWLKEISKIQGEFRWSPEAREWYREWYFKLKSEDREDRTGSINRLGDGAIKVAMLMTLADKEQANYLMIERTTIIQAVEKCLPCTHSAMKSILPVVTSNGTQANPSNVIIKALMNARDYTMDRQRLLSTVFRRVGGAPILDAALRPLQENGWIKRTTDKAGKAAYMLTDSGFREFCENNLASGADNVH